MVLQNRDDAVEMAIVLSGENLGYLSLTIVARSYFDPNYTIWPKA